MAFLTLLSAEARGLKYHMLEANSRVRLALLQNSGLALQRPDTLRPNTLFQSTSVYTT